MWLYICGQVLGGRAWPRRRRSVARVSEPVLAPREPAPAALLAGSSAEPHTILPNCPDKIHPQRSLVDGRVWLRAATGKKCNPVHVRRVRRRQIGDARRSPSRARCRVERRSSSASRLALRPKPIARRAGLEGPRPRRTVVVSGGTAGRRYPRRMAAVVGRPVARRRRG